MFYKEISSDILSNIWKNLQTFYLQRGKKDPLLCRCRINEHVSVARYL